MSGIFDLCRSGTMKVVRRKLVKVRLDLLGVQEMRQNKAGTEPTDNYIYIYIFYLD